MGKKIGWSISIVGLVILLSITQALPSNLPPPQQLTLLGKTATAPQQAIDFSYTENTFSSNFSNDEIDFNDTRHHGFKWYLGRFFGWKPTPAKHFYLPDDGPLTIKTGFKRANLSIATATTVKDTKRWVGQAFGGGGYFEAEIKFDPVYVKNLNNKGWPSFWTMAIEHMANLPESQWPSQEKGYVNFIEVDILEYLFKKEDNTNVYGANMHNWFGVWQETCYPKPFCKHSLPYRQVRKTVPPDTDFNKYHKYGFLWVPATRETDGFGQFYFDDKPIGEKITWEIYDNQSPSMIKQPWTFGIIDRQHLVLILGTGENQPMTIRSVNVWQKSGKNNLVQ
ncbi:MAG: hypothetical protein HF967_01900 [Methanosarcinales archaeon]|nr:hypothetical protein [Methanosarcinales archaeon]